MANHHMNGIGFDAGDGFVNFDDLKWDGPEFNFDEQSFNFDGDFPALEAGEGAFDISPVAQPTNAAANPNSSSPKPQQPTVPSSQSTPCQAQSPGPAKPTTNAKQDNFPIWPSSYQSPFSLAEDAFSHVIPAPPPQEFIDPGKLSESNPSAPGGASSSDRKPQHFYTSPQHASKALRLLTAALDNGDETFNPGHHRRTTNDSFFSLIDASPSTSSSGPSSMSTAAQSGKASTPTTSHTTPVSMSKRSHTTLPPGLAHNVDSTIFPEEYSLCKSSEKALHGGSSTPQSPFSVARTIHSSPFSKKINSIGTKAPVTPLSTRDLTGLGLIDTNMNNNNAVFNAETPLQFRTLDFEAFQIPDPEPLDFETFMATDFNPNLYTVQGGGHQLLGGFTPSSTNSVARGSTAFAPYQVRAAQSPASASNMSVMVSNNKRPVYRQYHHAHDQVMQPPQQRPQTHPLPASSPRRQSSRDIIYMNGEEYGLPTMAPEERHTPTFAPTELPQGYGVMPTRPEVIDLTGLESPTHMRIPAVKPPTKAAQAAQAATAKRSPAGKTINKRSPSMLSPGAFNNTSRISKPTATSKAPNKLPRFMHIPPERMADTLACAQKNGGFIPCRNGSMAKFTVDEMGNGKVDFGYVRLN